jgi:hypothetical protein
MLRWDTQTPETIFQMAKKKKKKDDSRLMTLETEVINRC